MDCRDNRQHRIRHQQVAPFYSGAMARIYSGVDTAANPMTIDLMGTDRVRRHPHLAIDPPLPTASPALPALIGSRSPSILT